ncbi:MAG: hypothetical protein QFE16_11195 [Pseudomonadota bacterium]|nr:hypothetical protein [Pseudomonadota bacterium]
MSSIPPLRCVGINQAILADDGAAVLLELIMDNGQTFPLELDSEGVELLSRVVLAAAHAMGTEQPDRPPLAETVPSESVQMSANEVIVRAHADGPVLALRVGSIDVTLRLPNQLLATALASAVAGGGKP